MARNVGSVVRSTLQSYMSTAMDIFGDTESQRGPSWARDNWPLSEPDAVNIGLDPTEQELAKLPGKAKTAAVADGA